MTPPARAQNPPPPRLVRIVVEDHSGLTPPDQPLPDLFMASSIDGWDPAGIRAYDTIQFERDGAESPIRAWTFELSLAAVGRRDFQFKFTRGDWSTVEVNSDGADITNRTIDHDQLTPNANSQIFLTLEGFSDQRGTRWPGAGAGAGGEPTVTGDLDVFTIDTDHLTRRPTIRVWLPPGYHDPANADRRYPVMYMHDGQNLFDAATSFIGVEWGVDETLTTLIEQHEVPPIIVVGIDNGPERAQEYNPPYTEWEGHSNHADRYVAFLADDLMPLINERFRTRPDRESTGIGGSSFGGAVTLFAIMERPQLFSRALVESPAVFLSDSALVTHLRDFQGPYPTRIFLGVGTREVEDADRAATYVRSAREINEILTGAGLPDGSILLVVEPDAIHNESAWARRLPQAMRFLWGE